MITEFDLFRAYDRLHDMTPIAPLIDTAVINAFAYSYILNVNGGIGHWPSASRPLSLLTARGEVTLRASVRVPPDTVQLMQGDRLLATMTIGEPKLSTQPAT